METRREWRAQSSRGAGRVFRLVRFVVVVFLVFLLIDTLLLSSVRVAAPSMEPTLAEGERLLVSPLVFGAKLEGLGARVPGFRQPDRGDIVVLRPPFVPNRSFFVHAADVVVSFFTGRRVSVLDDETESRWVVKRVIAVPGDTVRMRDFVASVRPSGESTFLPEFTLAANGRREYSLDRAAVPEGWDDRFPFSGALSEVTLGPGEYFVLGDNRASSLDSRHWGPVRGESILALVVVRYWPMSRFGLP